jgi:hypothetical protein
MEPEPKGLRAVTTTEFKRTEADMIDYLDNGEAPSAVILTDVHGPLGGTLARLTVDNHSSATGRSFRTGPDS